MLSPEERARVAHDNFPAMFSQATMIVDGTDCPCELKERTYGELSGQYRSYKLGAAALRTQVAILANRIICFVSHSVPALRVASSVEALVNSLRGTERALAQVAQDRKATFNMRLLAKKFKSCGS